MPGLASFLIENDGSYSDKTIEHYRLRAAGGPAMIIMEAHGIAPEGVVSNHQARIYDDRFINDLSKVVSVIKREGSIPAIRTCKVFCVNGFGFKNLAFFLQT